MGSDCLGYLDRTFLSLELAEKVTDICKKDQLK